MITLVVPRRVQVETYVLTLILRKATLCHMLLHNVKNTMLKREVNCKFFKILICGYNMFMCEANYTDQLRYITQEMLHHD